MIDHVAARRLAAIDLDFLLEDKERTALGNHLHECTECQGVSKGLHRDAALMRDLDLGPVAQDVRAEIAIRAERRGREVTGRWMALAAAVILLVTALGAATLGIGSGGLGDGAAPDLGGRAVSWSTAVVSLEASDFWIEADGRRFLPPANALVQVSSDPGTAERWTLEIAWKDAGVEQRMNLYFGSDGRTWRVTEARIYDGRVPGDWLTTTAPIAEAPIGTGFRGDVDVLFEERGIAGRLVMRGLELRANPQPIPGNGKPNVIVPADPVPGKGVPRPAPLPDPPYQLDCGPVDADLCRKIADGAVTGAAVEFPTKKVVRVAVSSEDGDLTLFFHDGTATGVDVN